jgi:hypothetical protein
MARPRRLAATLAATLTALATALAATGLGLVGLATVGAAPAGALLEGGTLSIGDAQVAEGNAGVTTMTFTVTLEGSAGLLGSSVQWATQARTATPGTDYTAASGTLRWSSGLDSSPKTIAIAVRGDTFPEPDEQFVVKLSNPSSATIANDTGVGTIKNDDGPAPAFVIPNVKMWEGTGGSRVAPVTVNLTKAAAQPISVHVKTADGTAKVGSDYKKVEGNLLFAKGEKSKTFGIPIVTDSTKEADETFFVRLSNPNNALLPDAKATITLRNDDGKVAVSVGNASVREGNSGTRDMVFRIRLSHPTTNAVKVGYGTASNTAKANEDYEPQVESVTFAAGQTSKDVRIKIVGDTRKEPNETFYFKITSTSRGKIASPGYAIGTIVDDD